jgi:hypothetical protein
MLATILTVSTVLLAVLALPAEAYAWGPVTHIVHGSTILANLTSLPVALQALLAANQEQYLYGCIGADIIQAKAYTRSLATHCHSWPVAWQLVAEARTEGEEAFAWGYMTHLGADIISHNHFVPANLLRSFDARTAGHAYWEARADGLQTHDHWARVRGVLRGSYGDCDNLVERVVEHTLFSFKTNKRIFDSLMGINKLDRWQALVATVNRRSRFALSRATVERYNAACVASATDLLVNQKDSYTQRQDATGREVLTRAISLRRKLRALKRKDRLPDGLEREMVGDLLPELLEPPAAA